MSYCKGCGRYIGDYSAYRVNVPGHGELMLCYHCRRWAERHPGQTGFPARQAGQGKESKAFMPSANLYVVCSFGLLAFGLVLILAGNKSSTGFILILAACSLFFIGVGMRRSLRK